MKFSQRIGITPLSKNLQIDSMDDDLRNGLWNIFNLGILNQIEICYGREITQSQIFSELLWHDFYKRTLDSMPRGFNNVRNSLRDWYFKAEWFEVYDLLQYCLSIIMMDRDYYFEVKIDEVEIAFNKILERDFSAYRFINGILSPITNEHEKLEIESALNNSASFTHLSGSNIHLTRALKMLSDKANPDYRNSIKESISAVESVAKIIAGNAKDELGTALSILKTKANLNAGLVSGFKSIYGWTSNSDGIRHGLMDEPNCDFDDAKYMLVSCSAFINYLISKAQKAGITLG